MDNEMDVEKTFIATKTPDTYGCGEGYSLRFSHNGKWRTLSIGKFNNKFEIQDDLPNMKWDPPKHMFPNSVDVSNCQVIETRVDDVVLKLAIHEMYTLVILKLHDDKKCHVFHLNVANISGS